MKYKLHNLPMVTANSFKEAVSELCAIHGQAIIHNLLSCRYTVVRVRA